MQPIRLFSTILLALILATALLCGCQSDMPAETTGEAETTTFIETPIAETQETTTVHEVIETNAPELTLPEFGNEMFTLTSGAGAWRTVLYLEPDGSFTGEHIDSDMGDIGDGYPKGIQYIANFTGKFSVVKKIDENRYSLFLDEITLEKDPGEEWIEDGVKYITRDAGLYKGREYLFVMPDLMRANLPEDSHIWLPDYTHGEFDVPVGYCGIIDAETGCGFFNYYEQ